MRGAILALAIVVGFLLAEVAKPVEPDRLAALRQADIAWQDECPGYVEVRPVAGNQLVTCYLTNVISPTPTLTPTPPPTIPTPGFMETFDGAPATPQPWTPADWDVSVHSRDRETWYELEPMAAQHGPNCEPPPGAHIVNTYEEAVYRCANHVMTALRASGYGVTYLTPNQLVDFSSGEAVIKLDVSTLRTSNRDWWDLWITPYHCNLVSPLEDWLPDLNGEPCQAVHIRMKFGSPGNLSGVFQGFVIDGFDDLQLSQARTTGYETLFPPSALLRQTFELRISQNRVRFGMPVFNLWWIDAPLALDWTQGVVQFGHHSYNPLKDCPLTCLPGTWHWDNVSINPAVPFTMLRADSRYADLGRPGPLTFPAPAPANSFLRFAGIGTDLEFSLDGITWQDAQIQVQESYDSGHLRTYWTAVPEGTDKVWFRGINWWGGGWFVRNIAIWSTE